MLIISVLASQILFPSPFKASLSPNVFVSNYLQKKFYYLKDILLEIVPARLVLTKTAHLLLSKVSLCLSTQWFTIYWISINFLKYGSLSKSNWKISSIVNHCFCLAALTWFKLYHFWSGSHTMHQPPDTTDYATLKAQKVCPQNKQIWHV